jgi:NADH-quinone oxidoreductase subunit G
MATVYVDGKPYQMDPEQNLLHGCLSAGLNLPYFCWHPALGSVGACRQCAVKQFKDENDTRGKIVMACLTPASEGTRISIDDPEAVKFRAAVIEGLMQSHPHDCPVCDEGGECHLQDMTLMTGHDYRRYLFNKRTFRNQYLGPFVNHEMNRCIQCYRCVRYYRDYAGSGDLREFRLRNTVFFGRSQDGVLENEFSGNLVEVCPTGVFTDATLKRHYTRKWDLQMAPSVCVHCGLGCNTTAGERYGLLRRIVNRYNDEVNGYFLCDRGRYGYEFVNSARRISQPLLHGNAIGKAEAREHLSWLLMNTKAVGIGSPRATLEANFALRTRVGPERFFAGIPGRELHLLSSQISLLRQNPARSPSLKEIENSDAVLILGEDVTNVAPRIALALRQSVRQQALVIADKLKIPRWNDYAVHEALQDERGPLFIASVASTRLDDVATETYRAAPDDIARLGFDVAHAISGDDSPSPLAVRIARALREAAHPLVIAGPSLNNEAILYAAAFVASALCQAGHPCGLSCTAPESNSIGLAMMDPRPLEAAREEGAETVVVLENDLYRRGPASEIDALLGAFQHVVVLDHLSNPTTERAELVLPAATFAEASGTLVSSEGRAQRSFQVFVPGGDVQESWRWLAQPDWRTLDDVLAALAAELPHLAPAAGAAPPASFRIAGAKVPREPHRYSGRTSMLANINVSEPKPPDDLDSPLSFSMEGSPDQPPPALTPFFWSPGWNSIQAVNKFQEEIGGPLRGGPAGVRLVEPGAGVVSAPGVKPFAARDGEWLAVPLYHIFGSEELSRQAPAVAELAPEPYVALNAGAAARLEAEPGALLDVTIDGAVLRLPLRIRPELPDGLLGLPAGVPPVEGVSFPAWARIART